MLNLVEAKLRETFASFKSTTNKFSSYNVCCRREFHAVVLSFSFVLSGESEMVA